MGNELLTSLCSAEKYKAPTTAEALRSGLGMHYGRIKTQDHGLIEAGKGF